MYSIVGNIFLQKAARFLGVAFADRFYFLIFLGIFYSKRKGAFRGLRKSDVDLETTTATIVKNSEKKFSNATLTWRNEELRDFLSNLGSLFLVDVKAGLRVVKPYQTKHNRAPLMGLSSAPIYLIPINFSRWGLFYICPPDPALKFQPPIQAFQPRFYTFGRQTSPNYIFKIYNKAKVTNLVLVCWRPDFASQ